MAVYTQVRFLTSANKLSQLPPDAGAEVAVAGRSNAGKSSAINAIAHRRKLAFTSKTPGRTQQIVMFRLPGGQYLVDLPGYGYAKVPDNLRRHWERTLGQYLATRGSLQGLALIMDARHPMTDLDRRMLDWFAPTGRPIHVLLTKADKLGRAEGTRTLASVRRALAKWGKQCTAQLFSSTSKVGIDEAEGVLAGWLGIAPEPSRAATQAKKSPSGEARAGTRRPRAKGDKHEAEMP